MQERGSDGTGNDLRSGFKQVPVFTVLWLRPLCHYTLYMIFIAESRGEFWFRGFILHQGTFVILQELKMCSLKKTLAEPRAFIHPVMNHLTIRVTTKLVN